MTPADAVSMLERQLAEHGQDAILRRLVPNAPSIEIAVRIFARGYRPDELANGIVQGDTLVTLSPRALSGTAFEAAPPRVGDRIVFGRRSPKVEGADPVSIGSAVVRINLQVRG